MYSIVEYKKGCDFSQFHYVLKSFDEFYNIARYLYLPLVGVYKLAVITISDEDVNNFIKIQEKYSHISVTIFMESQAMKVVEDSNPEANFELLANSYTVFKQLIMDRGLLFDRYMIYKLYRSIDHDMVTMIESLDKLVDKFGSDTLLTEDKISSLFVLNDVIYPSQVLLKFINMDNGRWRLLKLCSSQIDNDVLVGSIVKEIRKLMEAKAAYFKEGSTNDRIKNLNTQNLVIAYRVFISERCGINDAFLLFNLYENGLSAIDVKGGKNVII